MNKFGLTVAAVAALGLAACQGGNKGNNSANAANNAGVNDTTTVNGAAVGASAQNGLNSAGNVLSNAGDSIESGLNKAGDVIQNTGRAAANEVREVTGGDRPANTTATNTTGR